MAEAIAGLGVAASIIAIIQMAEEALKLCEYAHGVKNAQKEIKNIRVECESGLCVLKRLHDMFETTSNWPSMPTLQFLTANDGVLSQYKAEMEKLVIELHMPDGWIKSQLVNLKWPVKAKNIANILQSMERKKALLILATTMDHTALSALLAAELRNAADNIDIISENVIDVSEKLTSVAKAAGQIISDRVVSWLSPPDPSSNHQEACAKRHADTGKWFLEGEALNEWRSQPASFLWLHGIRMPVRYESRTCLKVTTAGAGKSVLCSSIIEHMSSCSSARQSTSMAVAYFYFDFNDVEKQIPVNAIRSLIAQFLTPLRVVPECIATTYNNHRDGRRPSTAELLRMLRSLVELYDDAHIFLDAMDECSDRHELLSIIKKLVDWKLGKLHILVTSRKERDIGDSLGNRVTNQISVQGSFVDSDISIYLRERIQSDAKLRKWPGSVQEEIIEVLGEKAEGMFRWVACQLDSLSRCHKLDRLRRALRSLPSDLDETYNRILSHIDSEDEDDAKKILQWLAFSARPVRVAEVAEALAMEYSDGPKFCPEQRLPDPLDILTICSSLVTISELNYPKTTRRPDTPIGEATDQSNHWELRLAHYSVKEYLISERIRKSPMSHYSLFGRGAHCMIAEDCLAYLLHLQDDCLQENTCEVFHLAEYAAEYWPFHARYENDDLLPDLEPLALRLFKPHSSQFLNWIRLHDEDKEWGTHLDFTRDADSIPGPLYYSCLLGISSVVKHLTRSQADMKSYSVGFENALRAGSNTREKTTVQEPPESGVDVNAQGGEYGNALQAASAYGSEAIVRLLLQCGADVNARGGKYGTALQAASEVGSKEIVQFLLECGADVNAHGGKWENALQAASLTGREDVVQILLDRGANANAQDGSFGNLLHDVSLLGNEAIVRLLVAYGASVNAQGGDHGSALQAAASLSSEVITRLLLESGADANMNMQPEVFETALQTASARGNEAIVLLLLEHGADVNAQSGEYGTALLAASVHGNEHIVRLLLEYGADVNAQGGDYGTALLAASCWDHEVIVQLLLKTGADVNSQHVRHGNALHAALTNENEAMVQLLLESGADANMESRSHRNTLRTASVHGNEAIVRLLLKHGADVNEHGGSYGPALLAASCRDHEEIVRLLLEAGANVNVQDDWHGNALHDACQHGNEETVRLLLERGADANVQSGARGNALHAASVHGNEAIVRLLLEYGADVNAQGGDYGSALLAASCQDHEVIERLLLDAGANVNAQDEWHGTALHAASLHGNEAIVPLMLERGADVNLRGGRYGNALQAASKAGSEVLVRLLLKYGAEVNAQGGVYGSALQAASSNGRGDVVRLLLKSGAEVALQAASYEVHKEVMPLLLEDGADDSASVQMFTPIYGSDADAESESESDDVQPNRFRNLLRSTARDSAQTA